MTKILDEVLAANAKYAANFGDKGNLPLPPSCHFAILTCMDARLDPAKYAGLAEGDAHVIRNAGGRASDDAIRSLVISYNSSTRPGGSSLYAPLHQAAHGGAPAEIVHRLIGAGAWRTLQNVRGERP
jgi:hypothetical protein